MACNRQDENKSAGNSSPIKAIDSITIAKSDTINQHAIEQQDSVLICIDYAEAPSFSAKDESYSSYTAREKNYFKGKKTLTNKFVRQQLFLNADSVFIQNIWSGDTVEKVALNYLIRMNHFYVADTVLNTPHFTGIVYELINGEGSEKYLFTFNRQGKVISKVSVAFYMHSGSYTGDDGSRLPWYATKTSCINSNLMLITTSEDAIQKFKIQADGKIIELK